MLVGEYLGICKLNRLKHLDENELLISAYPYRSRQSVLNELVANAIVGDLIPYKCREIEAVLQQVVTKLPKDYNDCSDSRICVKLSW